MNKFVTVDTEMDGLSRDINKKLFPKPPHYDVESRLWSVTFTDDLGTDSYVCKLPSKPRRKAYHEVATKVPLEIDNHIVTEIPDYLEFLWTIYYWLLYYVNKGYKICFKGYGEFNYDKDMLGIIFKKFDVDTDVLEHMINVHKLTLGRWKETSRQVTTSKWIDNQEYLINGLRHNIEDSEQLYNIIKEQINEQHN